MGGYYSTLSVRRAMVEWATHYVWPGNELDFTVLQFCRQAKISRSTYYRHVAPRLPEINTIRSRKGMDPIPAPKSWDYRRFLRNQRATFRGRCYIPTEHYRCGRNPHKVKTLPHGATEWRSVGFREFISEEERAKLTK